ncbi:hypothetical protein SAMN05414137_10246 [Streptacidiphilus jiangxiensis]|uniref:Uncharacterized protein n=1 Tax=Streptacidiphilus jiangxiensis TaxID=235985 RepID=A0A1H7H5T4_STRJI|nr:hypothetical protein SAMN05414137_10246 [Streptacidiphilus jiangxiensis]
MLPEIASRIPLVRRSKAPGLPLQRRFDELSALTVPPAGASHQDQVARACGVLNFAALIASDTGMPDLAAQLCWEQHQVFAEAGMLSGEIAVYALMPLVNIARLLTREGDGEAAYDVLHRLHAAALRRSTVDICGHVVDLSTLTNDPEDHARICKELWISVLIDGARALASLGRWTEAAEAMAAHRGIGDRLLDGRQIKIMSLMEQGRPDQACALIDSTTTTEEWEVAVAGLLRYYCRPADARVRLGLPAAVRNVISLISTADAGVAVFQARAGLTALDLLDGTQDHHAAQLCTAIAEIGTTDAYAAREILGHRGVRSTLSGEQLSTLQEVLDVSGLGAGSLKPAHGLALDTAVHAGIEGLRELLGGSTPSGTSEDGAETAVRGEDDAVEDGGGVTCKEQHQVGDFIGGCRASERDA